MMCRRANEPAWTDVLLSSPKTWGWQWMRVYCNKSAFFLAEKRTGYDALVEQVRNACQSIEHDRPETIRRIYGRDEKQQGAQLAFELRKRLQHFQVLGECSTELDSRLANCAI